MFQGDVLRVIMFPGDVLRVIMFPEDVLRGSVLSDETVPRGDIYNRENRPGTELSLQYYTGSTTGRC